jgi:hypothetical protein
MKSVKREAHILMWQQCEFCLDCVNVVDSDLVVQEGAEGGLSLHYTEDSPYRSDKSLTDNLVHKLKAYPNLVRYKAYPIANVKKMRRWQKRYARQLKQRFPNEQYHEWLLPSETTVEAFFRKPWSWRDWATWYATQSIGGA